MIYLSSTYKNKKIKTGNPQETFKSQAINFNIYVPFHNFSRKNSFQIKK